MRRLWPGLLCLFAVSCGASPLAPAKAPVCRTVTTPAVTVTTYICLGGICQPYTEVITPASTREVCE